MGLCSRSELALQGRPTLQLGGAALGRPLGVVKNYGQYAVAIAVDCDALQAWRWEC